MFVIVSRMICRTVGWASALLVVASCSDPHGSLITIKAAAPITDSTGTPLAGDAAVDVELFLGTAPDGLAVAEGTSWIRDVNATTDQLANVTAAQLESGISVLLDPTSPHPIDGVQLAVAAWPHDGPAPTAATALWFGHVLLNLDPSLTLGYTVTLANTPTSLANTAPVDCPQTATTTVGPSVYLWSGDSDTTDSCIRWVDADGAMQQQIVREHDRDCDGLVPSPLPLASCQYTDLAQCDPSVSDGTTVGWIDSDGDGYAENTIGTTHGVVMSTCQSCTGINGQAVECDCNLVPADFTQTAIAAEPLLIAATIAQMNPLINAGAPEIVNGFDDNCDQQPAAPLQIPGLIVTSGFSAPTCTTPAVAYHRQEIEDIVVTHSVSIVADTANPIADAADNVCLDFQCETPLLENLTGGEPCAISLEAPQDVSANVLPPIPVCAARYNIGIAGPHLCQSQGSTTYEVSLTKLIAPGQELPDYNAVGCEAQLWGAVPTGWDVELVDTSSTNDPLGTRDVSAASCSTVSLRIAPSITIDTDTVTTTDPPVVVAILLTDDTVHLTNLMAPIALVSQQGSCDNFSPCLGAPNTSNGGDGGGGPGPSGGN